MSPSSAFKPNNGVLDLVQRYNNYQEYFIRGKETDTVKATLAYINNAVFGDSIIQSSEHINIDVELETGVESYAERELRELAEEIAAIAILDPPSTDTTSSTSLESSDESTPVVADAVSSTSSSEEEEGGFEDQTDEDAGACTDTEEFSSFRT